jgi:hypothetical protein
MKATFFIGVNLNAILPSQVFCSLPFQSVSFFIKSRKYYTNKIFIIISLAPEVAGLWRKHYSHNDQVRIVKQGKELR